MLEYGFKFSMCYLRREGGSVGRVWSGLASSAVIPSIWLPSFTIWSVQEQTQGERQMSAGERRKSVFQHLSVNVICHRDGFLRAGLSSLLMVFVRKRKGWGVRKCISIHFPKVTYVFFRTLSFCVVAPSTNEGETFWIWIVIIRWLTICQYDRPYR